MIRDSKIFKRLLLETLVPVIVIITLMIIVLNNIVYAIGRSNSQNDINDFSNFAPALISEKYKTVSTQLNDICKYVSMIDEEERIDQFLKTLFADLDGLQYVWVDLGRETGGMKDFSRAYAVASSGEIESVSELDGKIREWCKQTRSSGELYFSPSFTESDFQIGTEAEIGSSHVDSQSAQIRSVHTGIVGESLSERDLLSKTFSITNPIIVGEEIVGCLGIGISYSEIFSFIEKLDVREKLEIMVILGTGEIIYPEGEKYENKLVLDPQTIESALESGEIWVGEELSPFFNEVSPYSLVSFGFNNIDEEILLYIDVPASYIQENYYVHIANIIFMGVAAIVVLIVLIFFTTGTIVRPIRLLTQNVGKIYQGDFSIVPSKKYENYQGDIEQSRDELLILEDALNRMIDQIALNTELETQRIAAEVARERVLESSHSQTRFFANMSHEIRTPMNSILGISQILLHGDDLTNRQRKYINDIKTSTDSLLIIINDILDISKLELGKMELVLTDYDFNRMLESISSMAESLADYKDFEFRFETKGDIPICLYGDPVRLRQILVNLLGNAMKFTHKGFVALEVVSSESSLTFNVIDTGIGIEEDELDTIFDAYTQAAGGKTKRSGSSGLGLSISKNLVELMDGKIDVVSEYGKGSTFTVTIPKILGNPKAIAEMDGNNSSKSRLFAPTARILVVDDNELNLNVASGLLKTLFGIECDVALSGRESIALIQGNDYDYDMVFMDHMMPEMDGVETVSHIRKLGGKYLDLVIVALTANAVIGTKDMLLASGMNDFISKPINVDQFRAILLKWLPPGKISVEDAELGEVSEDFGGNLAVKNEFISRASGISGLDVGMGLKYAAGNSEVYRKSLLLMRDKIPPILEQLYGFLEIGDTDNFRIHIHGMKSSFANIGARTLYKLALKLEKASFYGDLEFCKDSFRLLERYLSEFRLNLAELFA